LDSTLLTNCLKEPLSCALSPLFRLSFYEEIVKLLWTFPTPPGGHTPALPRMGRTAHRARIPCGSNFYYFFDVWACRHLLATGKERASVAPPAARPGRLDAANGRAPRPPVGDGRLRSVTVGYGWLQMVTDKFTSVTAKPQVRGLKLQVTDNYPILKKLVVVEKR
jgi:hypothetical protein